jgi:hypothetical protein
MFLAAIRSSFPKKTRKRHNKIKKKLIFLPNLEVLLFDGLPETTSSHSLNTS